MLATTIPRLLVQDSQNTPLKDTLAFHDHRNLSSYKVSCRSTEGKSAMLEVCSPFIALSGIPMDGYCPYKFITNFTELRTFLSQISQNFQIHVPVLAR